MDETSRRSRSPAADAATSETGAAATGATSERDDQTGENPGNNLYVANLATRVGQPELQELFAKYGRVSKCEVIVDPVTRESRYGRAGDAWMGTCAASAGRWVEGWIDGSREVSCVLMTSVLMMFVLMVWWWWCGGGVV